MYFGLPFFQFFLLQPCFVAKSFWNIDISIFLCHEDLFPNLIAVWKTFRLRFTRIINLFGQKILFFQSVDVISLLRLWVFCLFRYKLMKWNVVSVKLKLLETCITTKNNCFKMFYVTVNTFIYLTTNTISRKT